MPDAPVDIDEFVALLATAKPVLPVFDESGRICGWISETGPTMQDVDAGIAYLVGVPFS